MMTTTDAVDEAELAVLGAVVATGGRALDDIGLQGDDFSSTQNGNVFDVMRRMHASGQHIDTVTLGRAIPGQEVFLHTLSDHTPFAAAVQSYADIVAVHGMQRKLMAATDAIRGIGLVDMSASDMAERARSIIDDIAGADSSRVRFVKDILPGVIARMNETTTFVPSPWPTLDKASCPLVCLT